MAKHSTGEQVRAWGLSEGRTDVKEGRGRLAKTLTEAYNAAHPRAKYVPASKAPLPTVEVKVRPESGKGRTVTKKVNVATARKWASDNGKPVGSKGTLSKAVLTEYARTL